MNPQKLLNSCIFPFHNQGDLGITKNFRVITHRLIVDKVYDDLRFNVIRPEIKKILWKNLSGSDYTSNLRASTYKKSPGNSIVRI